MNRRAIPTEMQACRVTRRRVPMLFVGLALASLPLAQPGGSLAEHIMARGCRGRMHASKMPRMWPMNLLRERGGGGGYADDEPLVSSEGGGDGGGGGGDGESWNEERGDSGFGGGMGAPPKKGRSKRMRANDAAEGGQGKRKEESSKLRQIKLRRERQKKKMAGSVDTDNEKMEEKIRQNGGIQNFNSLLANEHSSDDIDRAIGGNTDLAEDGKWWEMSSKDEDGEQKFMDSKRKTQLAWDKDRGVSEEEEEHLKSMGVDPERFRKREGGDSMDESASEATKLQDMAVAGVQWNEATSKYERRTQADQLEETLPYQQALKKALAKEDFDVAHTLLSNLAQINFTSAKAVGPGLVKIVREIMLDSKVDDGEEISQSGGDGKKALVEPARVLVRKFVELSRREKKEGRGGGSESEDETSSSSSGSSESQSDGQKKEEEARIDAERRAEGDDDIDILGSAFQGQDAVIKKQMAVIGDNVTNAAAAEDWATVRLHLGYLEGSHVGYTVVDEQLVLTIMGLRKCGVADVEKKAHMLIKRWRQEAVRARSEAQDAVKGRKRGKGENKRGGDLTFDCKNVMRKLVDFYEGGKCVARNGRGNPKVSIFVMWGDRQAGRVPGSGTAGKGVSRWALRIDRCAGSSLYVGCMGRPYPAEEGYEEAEEWAMAGVVGEAYNIRYTGYLVGSHGMVWECTAKGPRSLTQQVMEHIGEDERGGEETCVTDGTKIYNVRMSKSLRFDESGSILLIELNRDAGELKLTVNQAPPFVLSGITEPVRPFVALKAVGDCVTLIDPSTSA